MSEFDFGSLDESTETPKPKKKRKTTPQVTRAPRVIKPQITSEQIRQAISSIKWDDFLLKVNERESGSAEGLFIAINPKGKKASYNRQNTSRYVKCAKNTIDLYKELVIEQLQKELIK